MNFDWVLQNADLIGELTLTHLWLTLVPTLIGLLISIPLGFVAQNWSKTYLPIVGGTSLFFTIPSLALFILLPTVLGTQILDPINVVVALVIYTIALLTRVVADGLGSVDPEVIQSARGMGFTRVQAFFRIEMPIAIPTIVSGLRVVVVTNISIATMAAVIGVAQLGTLFTLGFSRNLLVPIITGLIVALLLALVIDRALVLLGRGLTPWSRRGAM